jgi:cell division transport system permease protein
VSIERVKEVRGLLNKVTGIVSARLIEPAEALAQFEKRYANDASITEALKIVEKNPFGPTLVIKADNPDAYRNVIDTIAAPEYKDLISDQTFEDHAVLIEKISRLTSRMNQLGILLSAIFGFIALLIAMTTVRVAIYTHRETIGIMKLVGASNWFVRLPYLIQGVIFSFAALGVTLGIVYPLGAVLEPHLVTVFGGEALELSKYFHDSFWWIFGGELGAVMFLNVLVTSLAVGRYLKV